MIIRIFPIHTEPHDSMSFEESLYTSELGSSIMTKLTVKDGVNQHKIIGIVINNWYCDYSIKQSPAACYFRMKRSRTRESEGLLKAR